MSVPFPRTPPLPELRAGYRTDVYFRRTKQALEAAGRRPKGLMQVFQKKDALLCGMGEALAILAAGSGHYRDDEQADACPDGNRFGLRRDEATKRSGARHQSQPDSRNYYVDRADRLHGPRP